MCTAVLFVGMLVLFLFPALSVGFINELIVAMMVVMAITLCMYIPVFRKMKEE
ncbi:MAG: hypothetical protein ACLTWG_11965 [Blautia sp.]|uniref:hypothetical protein n=1 Tax=Blautia sp. TaxID=1955243 RepID=UPI0039925CE3